MTPTDPTPRRPFRERLREIMEPYKGGPEASRLSLLVDVFLVLAILVSCVLVPLEHALPRYHRVLFRIELGFTAIFAVEYLLRWYAARNRFKHPFSFYAVVDLLAILPTLLMLGADLLLLRAVRGIRLLGLLRFLRLVRLFRLLRHGFVLYRGLVQLRIWWSAVNHQYRLLELGRLLLWWIVAWFLAANVLHFTENRLAGPDSPFHDYWRAYWSTLVVLVSGVEDKEPRSLLGRIELAALALTGISLVALFTAEVVTMVVRRAQRAGKIALKPPRARLEQHILVLGANAHLPGILQELHAATAGQHWVLVVAPDAESLPVVHKDAYRRVFALVGDPGRLEVLEAAQIDTAWRVIVLASPEPGQPAARVDSRTLMETLAVVCRRRDLPIVVEVTDPATLVSVPALEQAGVEFVSPHRFGDWLVSQAVTFPGVGDLYDRLMSYTFGGNELYLIDLPEDLAGRTFAEAQLRYLDAPGEAVVLVGIDRPDRDAPAKRVLVNPGSRSAGARAEELVLRPDDRLVVISRGRPAFAAASREDLWAGRILQRT